MDPHHFQSRADQERFSAHMMKSSVMMAGTTMEFEFDERRGQAVGSRIGLSGKVLGLALEGVEVVTERDPPRRKVWEKWPATACGNGVSAQERGSSGASRL